MSNNQTHLTESQRQALHKQLVETQVYCRSKLAELRGERDACARNGEVGNIGDRSSMVADFHRTVDESARVERKLRAVASALRRFGDDYGICTSCDEPIDPRRLEFDPTIELCIHCAEAAAHGHRH